MSEIIKILRHHLMNIIPGGNSVALINKNYSMHHLHTG